ncbi:Long-chain fatty acid transport protein [Verrucomicrobium sp. GAS474]|uniref:OmpP1/FadL family transporter n=1 Tax=Verrucomicrobium sp. GAS474 TaxID=1882831 RepID=UPI00087BC192|nr:outer membrane protein transport protein [Verrucomicrobium sp. GAS474]SDT91387.1 Long-chain fatty acid transport protein [Verrucomicrobium sp. GAS474]
MLPASLTPVHAGGVYGNGVGARSMGMGGADVAWASDPLGAMGVNPAGLADLTAPTLNLGGVGGMAQGHFNKPGISSGNLDMTPMGAPEFAFGTPAGSLPFVVGLSLVPEAELGGTWHYNDPPGGLAGTTSYGNTEDKSSITSLRSALGAAGKITSAFSVGASVGLIYNENRLVAPYTFQNLQPGAGGPANSGLNGAKTLLDLRTSGLGWNAQVGMLYRATPDLQFGLSYESKTKIHSTGDATGDPSQQFGQAPGSLPFHYDATADTKLPQEVRAGVSWKFLPKWRLALQMDWIDWASAFDSLPLTFKNGNNATVNGALGSSFSENVPLNWDSQFVYRAGVEYNLTEKLTLRGGYCYGNSPVPASTLSPLTAGILEHTLTTGLGYQWKQLQIDLAYQYDLPATQTVGNSALRSGDYSYSSTTVEAHTVALTTTVKF